MPLSVSTLTPLEPSAGKGPAVSSGISAVAPGAASVVVPAASVVAAAVPEESLDDEPQPTTAARPPAATSWRARRRVMQRQHVELQAPVVIVHLSRSRPVAAGRPRG